MSKCDLSIEFDRSDRTFRPGETVSGKVTVQVNAKCQCDGLEIARLWHTHGRGNYDEGGREGEVVFSGEWWPGEVHSYPFSFEVPAYPVTYRGKLVNVDHYITARADIPWAIDPKAEEEFLLVANEASVERARVVSTGVEQASAKFQAVGAACGLIFGGIFFCAGVIPLIVGIVGVAGGEMSAVMAIPFGLIFMLVGGGIAFAAVRKALAEKKLGKVEVELEPRALSPGDSVEVSLRFAPKTRVTLNGITATLKGGETAISGSGTNRTTHSHDFYEEPMQLLEAYDVFPEEGVTAKGTFRVPADAAPSFQASDNRVTWSIQLHIDIARWPDWTTSETVIVLPIPAG